MPLIAKNIISDNVVIKQQEVTSKSTKNIKDLIRPIADDATVDNIEQTKPNPVAKELNRPRNKKKKIKPNRQVKYVGAKNVKVNKERFFYKDSPYIREIIDN